MRCEFHTKAIKVSDDLIHMITTNEIDLKVTLA